MFVDAIGNRVHIGEGQWLHPTDITPCQMCGADLFCASECHSDEFGCGELAFEVSEGINNFGDME